jgi:hypothetical protein
MRWFFLNFVWGSILKWYIEICLASYQCTDIHVLHEGKVGLFLVKVDHHANNFYESRTYRSVYYLQFLFETYFDVVKI